jgi:hypothetical protein
MVEHIYRYRDFEVTISVGPFGTPDPSCGFRFTGGYLCHVSLSGQNGHRNLPALSLLDESGCLFVDEFEAVLTGCLASEAAIDAALGKNDAIATWSAVAA